MAGPVPWRCRGAFDVTPDIHMGPMKEMLQGGKTFESMSFCFGDSWCDLDLVSLNADLGSYFGTSDGVLVVKSRPTARCPSRAAT